MNHEAQSLKQVKQCVIPLIVLLGLDYDANIAIGDVLPSSLERICFTDDLDEIGVCEWTDDGFLQLIQSNPERPPYVGCNSHLSPWNSIPPRSLGARQNAQGSKHYVKLRKLVTLYLRRNQACIVDSHTSDCLIKVEVRHCHGGRGRRALNPNAQAIVMLVVHRGKFNTNLCARHGRLYPKS